MAKILNVSFKKFKENVESKKIIMWGAGKLATYYIKTFCKGLDILFIVDSNENLCGKVIKVDNIKYPIISESEFIYRLESNKNLRTNVVIFITPTAYAGEIIAHINKIPLLDIVDCYIGVLLRDFYERSSFTFSTGEEKIPRKIHYCWFGGKDIPVHLKKYIESWHKFCPNYEIIRWDENNYDISKNRYMKEAYECKKWGFVPDYARLDIIYNEGGIYLDTDVELLAPLDRLLKDDMFCGFQCNYQINFGSGFGAIKNHPLIKKLRDYYKSQSFYLEDGQLNLKTCYEYQHPVLEEFGFQLENHFQRKDGVVVYPSEVLAPSMGLISDNYTENTVSVHRLEYSWANEKEKKAFELFKKNIMSGKFRFWERS